MPGTSEETIATGPPLEVPPHPEPEGVRQPLAFLRDEFAFRGRLPHAAPRTPLRRRARPARSPRRGRSRACRAAARVGVRPPARPRAAARVAFSLGRGAGPSRRRGRWRLCTLPDRGARSHAHLMLLTTSAPTGCSAATARKRRAGASSGAICRLTSRSRSVRPSQDGRREGVEEGAVGGQCQLGERHQSGPSSTPISVVTARPRRTTERTT